ncbi:DUF2520 domain-containing protein, partial [Candidatus Kapabacteria bacterium]|nr:DUF2520 domain-containing protein [Candidatus Kapabacteria bacterium]
RLGLTIAIELLKITRLEWVLAHSKKSMDRVLKKIYNRFLTRTKISEIDKLPSMIIIATPDAAIEDTAEELAEHFGKNLKGVYLIHCSGVLSRDVLNSCEKLGAKTAACHPFQTFIDDENKLEDIRWGIESTDEDYSLFASFVDLLYGFPVRLNDHNLKEKALYHAVATAASNYMTTIIQLANKIADSAKIDSKQFLPPIAKTTLGNNLRGLTDSQNIPLSGPIARADLDTIRIHLDALNENPELLRPYCYMGLATAEMAHNAGILDADHYSNVNMLFRSKLNEHT